MPFRFSDICELLSSLEKLKLRDPPLIPKQLQTEAKRVVEYWFRCHRRSIDSPDTDGAALLSTLFPERRTDRVYGLQETRLSRVIARCLRLNATKSKALQDWKTPGCGDLGDCVERALKDFDCEPKPGSFVTVEEVDKALQELASRCRFSGPDVRSAIPSCSPHTHLEGVYLRLKSIEAKWLTRLILKDFSPVVLDAYFVFAEFHFLLPGLLRFQDSFFSAIALLRGPLKRYHAKPDLPSQRLFRREAAGLLSPRVGVKVGRPPYFKARSMEHCVNMAGTQTWSVERKYDGEYCEIHVDLTKGDNCIKIFSKSGKDSTVDRKPLHPTIRQCLRIGQPGCAFSKKCIVIGEMVVWSDKDHAILEFHKIRKHVSRSGVFIGADQDSQRREDERLMVVFFDILMIDDDVTMGKPYAARRKLLNKVICKRQGYSITAERITIDFSRQEEAPESLCHQFAAAISQRAEGLVLKPLDMPYFNLDHESTSGPGCVIKLKKDYLQELGGERDVADLAVIGASYDPKQAYRSNAAVIQYTTFHLGCLKNKEEALRFGRVPVFEVVGIIDLDQCIPKPELQTLNNYGRFRSRQCLRAGDRLRDPKEFDLILDNNAPSKIDYIFTEPCVVEVLGSGFEKAPNKSYFMLRHPRILKVHLDRSWRDATCLEELQNMADIARNTPEEGVSQEMSQLVKKLMGKFRRKAEANRLRAMSTPRSEATTSPGFTKHTPLSSEHNSSSMCRNRGVQKKRSPVLVRIDTEELRPGEAQLTSSEDASRTSASDGGRNSPQSPSSLTKHPLAFQTTSPPNRNLEASRPILRKRGGNDVDDKPRKLLARRRSDNSRHENTLQPLADVSYNWIKDPIFPSRTEKPRPKSSPATTSAASTTTTIVTCTAPAPSCNNTRCPFSKAVVYLSPCISTYAWVSETLLHYHSLERTTNLQHWQRETLNLPPLGTVIPESMAWPGLQKLVLIEHNRIAATRECVETVKRLGVRETVFFFDWRILEEWMRIEEILLGGEVADDVVRREVFQRHFCGLTRWSGENERVEFLDDEQILEGLDKWLEV